MPFSNGDSNSRGTSLKANGSTGYAIRQSIVEDERSPAPHGSRE
jgi:hypothetical protein